uniref:Uncharacterized protein n=1 Tax=Amphimedon queenslandica TaxID=400682 RepID=A0A1X7U486_AMPQE
MDRKNSYRDFLKLHDSFDRTLIIQDDRKICAMMCYSSLPTDLVLKSRQIHILTPGAGYILPEYQRRGILHKFFFYMTLREHAYPCYDRPTPDMEKRIMEYYALHYLKCSDTYDPERGVVQLPQTVKKEVGAIDEKHLKNPHVKYYAERTNWEKGEALLGVANVSWKVIASIYNNWK